MAKAIQIIPVLGISLLLTGSALPYGWLIFQGSYVVTWGIYIGWFIGVVIGGLISGFTTNTIQKHIFCWTSGILTIVSGVLFIVFDEEPPIVVGLYFSGIAYGLFFIPGLIYAGEIADDGIRGSLCGLVGLSQSFAVTIPSILVPATVDYGLDDELVCGCVSIGAACIGIIFFVWYKESPVYLILQNNEEHARQHLEVIKAGKRRKSTFFDQEMISLKELVAENPELLSKENIWSLLRLLLIRFVYALSISVLTIAAITDLSLLITWPRYGYLLITMWRFVFNILSVFVADWTSYHRYNLLSSLIVAGLCMIIFVGILYFKEATAVGSTLTIPLIGFSTAIGKGIDTVSATYLSVAFPPRQKSQFLFIILVFETCIHVLLFGLSEISSYKKFVHADLLTLGLSSLSFGLFLIYVIPDTTKLTLKNCYEKMKSGRA